MSGPDSVRVRQDGAVCWITLNRPDRLNAFAGDMRSRLHDAVLQAARHGDSRVIVITGAGRGFSAGADLDGMEALLQRNDRQGFAELLQVGSDIVRAIRSAPQPVIAALNGPAAGAGASLALACDVRIASAGASLGMTFGRIGLIPDWGATYFLPRLVGAGRAAELILSARMVPADEAERIGLFQRVFPAEQFEKAAHAFAHDLAARSPNALAGAKAVLDESLHGTLDAALRAERQVQTRCFAAGDVEEGVRAFREKRAPVFRTGTVGTAAEPGER